MAPDAAPETYPDLGPDPLREVRVVDAPAVPTAVVRVEDVMMSAAAGVFDAVFGTAFPAAFEQGMTPAGAAFALYTRLGEGPDALADLEIGFPLAAPLADPIDAGEYLVRPAELPAGRIAVVSHVGGYEDLGAAWGRFISEIGGMGRAPGMPFWETYVTEPRPDMDPATLRTDLFCPADHPDDAA